MSEHAMKAELADLRARLDRIEIGRPATMSTVERTLAIRELARRTLAGDKRAQGEYNRRRIADGFS